MDYVIEMLGITKEFPGIKANDNITLKVKKGEIHALLGENGAGKSTLMSVLFGMYHQDKGQIKIKGKEENILSPRHANLLGIGMVHQHFKLIKDFTVLENIILGVETTTGGILKMEDARKKVMDISDKYSLSIDPDKKVRDITVGMQQRVEILKMLYRENDILIFDEPTAVLTPSEINELMKIMKELAKEGKSILFISHKLNEIKEVADNCTVLRHGKLIGTVDVKETSKEKMSEMMVGRKVNFAVEKEPFNPQETVLQVKNLCVVSKRSKKNVVNNVSFSARAGEILCIAGIDGNGQTELVEAISGLIPCDNGNVFLNGKNITKKNVRYRNVNGISHIPEDRHRHGLILDFSLYENIALKKYFTKRFSKMGFLKFSDMRKYAGKLIKDFDIRCSQGTETTVRQMSGGNQQKAIIAREVDQNNNLLIAVQPTRGLDVGAIEFIHKQIVKQRESGKAVLLVSLELDEVMKVSDRILVMFEGEIVADLNPSEVTVAEMGMYMSGLKRMVPHE